MALTSCAVGGRGVVRAGCAARLVRRADKQNRMRVGPTATRYNEGRTAAAIWLRRRTGQVARGAQMCDSLDSTQKKKPHSRIQRAQCRALL